VPKGVKLTREEFIKRAQLKHGFKYAYGNTQYVNGKTRVIITCFKHGDFIQRANHHLDGRGCRHCSISASSTTQSNFIEKAKERHGNAYSYTKTRYLSALTRVSITCRVHGDFEQTPHSHLQGSGCPQCGHDASSKARSATLESFIQRATIAHGCIYSYSNAIYINDCTKVFITCPEHGDFEQTPNNHLKGQGCPKCGRGKAEESRRLNLEEFIRQANREHKGRYTYQNSVYTGALIKLSITCPTHGDYKQSPDKHMRGQGCPKCKESRGERSIRNVLDSITACYQPQYKFLECRDRHPLPFDFALMKSGVVVGLIEYHGQQHYTPVRFFGISKERAAIAFGGVQKRDYIKERFTADKGIPLLVVPHWEFATIKSRVVRFVNQSCSFCLAESK
jgi:hypothetical protein